MCVVAAFIEHNIHPALNSMVPSIIIDTCQAQVALYCRGGGTGPAAAGPITYSSDRILTITLLQ